MSEDNRSEYENDLNKLTYSDMNSSKALTCLDPSFYLSSIRASYTSDKVRFLLSYAEGMQASPPKSVTDGINKISELNSMLHTFALHSASNLKLIQSTSLCDRKVPHKNSCGETSASSKKQRWSAAVIVCKFSHTHVQNRRSFSARNFSTPNLCE